jgi:uncharacterized protein
MKKLLFYLCLLFVLAVVAGLTGCASSPPPKFYQLSSVRSQSEVTGHVAGDQSLIVSIGPVTMPDYLDRPQIVTRSSKNEFNLAEFNRWAGSLENNVSRVLMEDISTLLPADRFFVMRWLPYLESEVPVSYRVQVRVVSFEGTPGDSVLLRAQWSIVTKGKGILLMKESSISEQMNGSGYDALVASMSRAIEKLSREVADGIMSLPPETDKRN